MLIEIARAMRCATPRGLRRLAHRIGHFLNREESHPSMEASFHTLKVCGFSPAVAVDVGAYRGEWMRMFKGIFPETRVLMLEAQDEKMPLLQSACGEFPGTVACENALLGASEGKEVEFAQMETGSSVFEEASAYPRTMVKKRLVTLDSVIRRRPEFREVDFLKLDVQGYELEVLKGAAEVLGRTKFVLMETSLVALNKGGPLLADVIAFMSVWRFRLADFCSQTRRSPGVLLQTDLLFVSDARFPGLDVV